MALSIGGQALQLPSVSGGREAADQLFTLLCNAFRLDPKVATHLVSVAGLESMDDFTHFFTSELEVETKVIEKIEDLSFPGIQASRLRQAWAAARQAATISDTRKKRGIEDDDFDSLLPNSDLRDIRAKFYARYRLGFGVKTEPCDHLVSRISKELSRRLLQARDGVGRAACASERLFARASAGAFGFPREDVDASVEHDEEAAAHCGRASPGHRGASERVRSGTAQRRGNVCQLASHTDAGVRARRRNSTRCIAMLVFPASAARAGVVQLDPQPAEPEAVDRDSTDYVEVRARCIARSTRRPVAAQAPLDVMIAYRRRPAQRAAILPPASGPPVAATTGRRGAAAMG